MEESKIVTAIRAGVTKVFTQKQWDVMGTDKYGWEIVVHAPETPKEVADTLAAKIEKPKRVKK